MFNESLLWKILGVTFLLFVLVMSSIELCHRTTATGQRVGTIVKFAQEGLFHKTWEMEIIRGGMAGGSGAFGMRPFYVTIRDPLLLQQVQEAYSSQHEVEITYYEKLFTPWDSECNEPDGNLTVGCNYLTSIKDH